MAVLGSKEGGGGGTMKCSMMKETYVKHIETEAHVGFSIQGNPFC